MTWHGKQAAHATRTLRELKRAEAEVRNAATPHENTKAHRLGRCKNCEENSK
jgi:hypothetical protein